MEVRRNEEQTRQDFLLDVMQRGIIAPESLSLREISSICEIAADLFGRQSRLSKLGAMPTTHEVAGPERVLHANP